MSALLTLGWSGEEQCRLPGQLVEGCAAPPDLRRGERFIFSPFAKVGERFDGVLGHSCGGECDNQLRAKLSHVLTGVKPQADNIQGCASGLTVHPKAEKYRPDNEQLRDRRMEFPLGSKCERMAPPNTVGVVADVQLLVELQRSRIEVACRPEVAQLASALGAGQEALGHRCLVAVELS